jgi:YYY domain-containing protein
MVQSHNGDLAQTTLPPHHKSKLPGALTAILLLAILLFGGYLRYTGQNWDDFSALHPDERFLTLNLLPLVGGAPEFTHDETGFPSQSVLISLSSSDIFSRFDIQSNPSARVGAINGTIGLDVARWWLNDDNRVVGYETQETALSALNRGEVAALILDDAIAKLLTGSTVLVDNIASPEVQRMRCIALNPATGGSGGYFDTDCSPLNPHNAGAGFYAYGTLPLFIAHFASQFVAQQTALNIAPFDFQGGPLVWRFFSALFDCGTILLIFFIGARLHGRGVGLLAALLYAAFPLAIQKAHFGTVNAITTFFVALAIWAAAGVLSSSYTRLRRDFFAGLPFYGHFIVFGIGLGAAIAGRINIVPLAGVIVLAAMLYALPGFDKRLPWHERQSIVSRGILGVFLAGIVTVLVFRICNPYAFQGPNFWNILIDERWLSADVLSAAYGVSGNVDSPPNWQWLARPSYIFPLKDMLLWGIGIAAGIMAWFGCLWATYQLLRGKPFATRNALLVAWVLVYFLYMGRQWVMTMRYYLPLYPALAVLAAWAVFELIRQARQHGKDILLTRLLLIVFAGILGAVPMFLLANAQAMTTTGIAAGSAAVILLTAGVLPNFQRRAVILGGFVALFTVVWGLMFTNIYRNQLTRVQAAHWLWENISGDFSIRLEDAPAGTPLINIAVQNKGTSGAMNTPTVLFESATPYLPNQPYTVEFLSPVDGTASSVYSPHLGDMDDDADAETLYVSIAEVGADEPLAMGTLTVNMPRDEHILGSEYEIPLNSPITFKAGQRYLFKAESLNGAFVSAGAVVLTEGDWDDRLTSTRICTLPLGTTLADNPPSGLVGYGDCKGRESWWGLVQSYDLAMSYPVDDALKRENIIGGLHVGDYLTITSNRFYDTEPRNRLRFPLTSYYYEALFAGKLGYELVAVFDESFEFANLSASDQHLPIYNSPQWFNEFEADEAFHVYDHPAVFIFQKKADYDPAHIEFALNSVPLATVNDVFNSGSTDIGANLIGVVYWNTLQTDDAPTHLMLTPEALAQQQAGGTWSERFDSASLLNTNQAIGAVAWWLTLMLFGFAAFPLLFVLLPGLHDRGYAFAKFAGLFLVSYFSWVASSAKIPLWSQAGVLLSLLLVALLSLLMGWRRRHEILTFVREHRSYIVSVEILTLLLFAFFIVIRLTNPDLWHFAKGGEKPMDFAYFNGVLRSTVFPPIDPWYSGGYINYYYFGFVLVGSPVLLLKLVPAFAYNLIIPTLFALTGIGAFAAAYNIVAAWKERQLHAVYDTTTPRRLGNPYAAGIAAMLLCVLLGNLDTIRVLGIGIAQLGGYRTPTGMEQYFTDQYINQYGIQPLPEEAAEIQLRAANANILDKLAYEFHNSTSLISSLFSGIGRLVGGAPLPIGSDRWYWGPSRVLAETPGVEGNAITEMPYFTFLYGDLHAHMINLPVMLFAIGWLFNELILAKDNRRTPLATFLSLAFGATIVGMMRATNTWDWPSFMVLGVVGLGYGWWLRWQHTPQWQNPRTRLINRWAILDLLATVGGFIIISFAAAIPFTSWYAATYGSVLPWDGGKTPLWAYWDIHGLFLFLLISLLLWETARWLRSVKVRDLRGQESGLFLTVMALMGIVVFALLAALISYQVALIALPLILWIVPLFFRRGQSLPMQYVLVLAGFALSLTMAVEIVVLGGDIGRQNTVFKFYMQAWVLFSVVGGAAFAWLFQASDHWWNRWRVVWYVPLMLLVMVALMFPIMATRGRSFDRMTFDMPLTLNGIAYMQYASHNLMDYGETIELRVDYAIIRWLQENVQGSPTIMEGRSLVSEYRWNGRIAINTGLPSVLGWNFHQRQQRTFDPLTRLVEQREYNVKYFYNTADMVGAVRILRHYAVQYIIIAPMERAATAPEGIAKFDSMVALGLITPVFDQDGGIIYEVNHTALDDYALKNR